MRVILVNQVKRELDSLFLGLSFCYVEVVFVVRESFVELPDTTEFYAHMMLHLVLVLFPGIGLLALLVVPAPESQ